MNFRKLYFLFLFALTSILTFAQNISFKAEANKKTVAIGDILQVGFFIESDEMDYTIDKAFRYPDHQGFRIVGEEKTQQVQYVNGRGQIQDGMILIFRAEKEGKFKIGSARISIDGKTYSTKPIDVEVVKSNAVTSSKNTNQPVFLQANVSNSNPYVNEQINLTVKMFSRDLGLLNRKRNFRQGKLEGLSPKMVTSRPETIKQEMVSGKQYFSEEVAKYTLFPEKEGKITIDPFSVDILVSGIYGTEAYEIRSNPVVINAKPIPQEGRPKSFTGAVGEFQLKSEISKNDIKANESSNLKVEISGTGNFNKLIVPEVIAPKNIETYSPKRSNNFKTYEDGMHGSIASEIIMVPEEEGSYSISPVEFSYFDPKKEKFVTLRTDEVKLSVNGKVENTENNNLNISSSDNNKDSFFSNKILLTCGVVLALAIASLFIIKRKKENNNKKESIITENSDKKFMPNEMKEEAKSVTKSSVSLNHKKQLNTKLETLQQNIHNPDFKTFYQLQEDLLCQIGMDFTAVDLANFSDVLIVEKLTAKGWNVELIEEWKILLEKARQAKYSAINSSDDDLTDVYFKTEKLVNQFIEK